MFAILKIANKHVEQVEACLLRAPVALAGKLCLRVREEAFQRLLVKPLSYLYQKISTSSTRSVVRRNLATISTVSSRNFFTSYSEWLNIAAKVETVQRR